MNAHGYIQANTNGRLHSAAEPSISPLNRGFLYGDAIYEVWRTYGRVIFGWDEHWARLLSSARALHLVVPWSDADIVTEIKRTVTAFRTAASFGGDVYVRLQISRGEGPIGLDVALADVADYVILVQPCPELTREQLRSGLTLSIATKLRRNPVDSLSPAWKTGNYLNNILCLQEARTRQADEVVILNAHGEITEAAVSNVAFVRGDVVITPPLAAGILAGVTRRLLLTQVAPRAGIQVREEHIRPADLAAFTECFLLSSTKDIAPVAAIDDHRFMVGDETVSRRLKTAFSQYANAYAEAHPELRV